MGNSFLLASPAPACVSDGKLSDDGGRLQPTSYVTPIVRADSSLLLLLLSGFQGPLELSSMSLMSPFSNGARAKENWKGVLLLAAENRDHFSASPAGGESFQCLYGQSDQGAKDQKWGYGKWIWLGGYVVVRALSSTLNGPSLIS